ncbi:MAG TPA: selenide, water dikinase SelD [Phnomibacter sp.]|nr:selenide, water dikinase SelD [Phnomibacter sp.]
MDENRSLTSFSKASGCGCKLPPALLREILDGLTTGNSYPQLMVGNDTADDASVYRLNDELALLQTVDFFTPIVNDPVHFGRIGAANAIGDIYAMGGRPLMANVVLGFPADHLSVEQIRGVLQGAAEVCKEAGIPMAGGHSINISEMVFGLSVTGMAHPSHIKTNAGARPGDLLLLTRPLGTGILGAAIKRGLATPEDEAALASQCSQLNKVGEALGAIAGVHAITDVTGFGFYGHLLEMCRGAGLSAEVRFSVIPLMNEAKPFAAKFVLPDNTFRNSNAVKDEVLCDVKEAFAWLNDPQTNGGLLLSVHPDAMDDVGTIFRKYALDHYLQPIGVMEEKGEVAIRVIM